MALLRSQLEPCKVKAVDGMLKVVYEHDRKQSDPLAEAIWEKTCHKWQAECAAARAEMKNTPIGYVPVQEITKVRSGPKLLNTYVKRRYFWKKNQHRERTVYDNAMAARGKR